MLPFSLRSKKNKEPIFIVDSAETLAALPGQESETRPMTRGAPLHVSDEIPLLKIKRLVVLVPDQDLDDVTLSREVWSLASQGSHQILYMTVIQDPDRESRARRRLITLAAITRDAQTRVEAQVCFESSYIKAVKNARQEGDMLVCMAGNKVSNGLAFRLGKRVPLEIALVDSLRMPVILLTGIYQEQEEKSNDWLRTALYWSVTLAILALFTWFEMAITQAASNWVGQLLLILTILIEAWAVVVWTATAG